ncbi:uncharacterized protein [Haliotis asinina]|uniref:uncharacterized protein n=1 Tax=Haliotis asinina TaxID=109174 RepID=UPI003531CF7A
MSATLIQKKVKFCGVWKPSSKASNDALLRQISVQFLEKKSLVSNYQLCEDGLRLHVIQENGRKGSRKSEKIPFTGIQDICVNRYNSTCLMTVYVDAQRRSNYLVCRCESEHDVSQIVLAFKDYKKSLAGEGYKIDLVKPQGTNWTLMPKHDNVHVNGHSEMSSDSGDNVDGGRRRDIVTHNGIAGSEHQLKVEVATETFEREPCEIEGRPGFSVAVQTNFGDVDSDRESMISSTSYRSLKDELLSLSQEIREIKFLLEKTTGISTAEYFKKDLTPNGGPDQRKYLPVPVDELELPSPTDSANSADKRVNFDMPDHDIRSFGVQTEKGQRKGYYTKRTGRSEVRAMHPVRGTARHRSSSSSSVPRSPGSIGRSGGNDVFDVSSHERAVYIRGSEQHVRSGYTTTIERPIEDVYSRNFRNPRKKIVVMPSGHATMPALRRPKSSSYSSSMNDLEDSQAF